MLRINRNTSALTVSLLFGLLSITSCGFDDGYDKEDTGDDNVKVAFRMAFVNDNTRAVNDGWETTIRQTRATPTKTPSTLTSCRLRSATRTVTSLATCRT